jgi:hypothetical protein
MYTFLSTYPEQIRFLFTLFTSLSLILLCDNCVMHVSGHAVNNIQTLYILLRKYSRSFWLVGRLASERASTKFELPTFDENYQLIYNFGSQKCSWKRRARMAMSYVTDYAKMLNYCNVWNILVEHGHIQEDSLYNSMSALYPTQTFYPLSR